MKPEFKLRHGVDPVAGTFHTQYHAMAAAQALSARSRTLVRVLDGQTVLQSFLFGKPQRVADPIAVTIALAKDEFDSSSEPKPKSKVVPAPASATSRPIWALRHPGAGSF